MKQLPRKAVLKALEKKGFERREGSTHTMLQYINSDGQRTAIRTQVSRGTQYKSLGSPRIASMAMQCGISKKDFLAFVDCSLSQEKYEEKLFGLENHRSFSVSIN